MNGCLVIVERELLGLLRNRRTLLILVTTAIAFAAVVILKWPSSGVSDLNGRQARETWQWLTSAMLGAAILIVPVFPSTSLVNEIRGRTLELLLNSPLSRAAIYFGKAGAMLGFVSLLLFTTLPAMACCFLMGGLTLTEVLRLYGFLLLVCAQLIVIGILVGTFCRSTEAALRWSYGVTFAITIVPTFPDFFMKGGDSPIARGAGKYDEAVTVYNELLKSGNQNAERWLWLIATSYRDAGKYKEAIGSYRQCNNFPANYQEMASCHRALKEYGEAVILYNQIVSGAPNSAAWAMLQIGFTQELAGNKESAIKSFQLVCKNYPKDGHASQAHAHLQTQYKITVTLGGATDE